MLSRRGFLKTTSIMGLGLILDPMEVFAKGGTKWPAGPIMIIDLGRCMGCEACVVACKAAMDLPEGVFNTRVLTLERDIGPRHPHQVFVPILCNQCHDAPCMAACPKGAIFRDPTGIIVTDWSLCDGSGQCVAACPFGARYQDPRFGMKSNKCNFCLERLDQGLAPICVETCPSGARIFGFPRSSTGELGHYLNHVPLYSASRRKGLHGRVLYARYKAYMGGHSIE